MSKPIPWLFWIVICTSGTESASAQRSAVGILHSRAGEKLVVKVDPVPPGEVDVHITLFDPSGSRLRLPPMRASGKPGSRTITGPELPAEARGFLVEVELRDPESGRKIGRSATWVT
jgi:hypothetical protein